jgi:uncharacterized alpha-E superfamily protein
MRRQQGRVSRDAAVSFLLFEARFPRSLRYCVRSAVALTRRLGSQNPKKGTATALGRLDELDRWLDAQEGNGIPLSVHALLTHVVEEASLACDEMQQSLGGDDDGRIAQPEAAQ